MQNEVVSLRQSPVDRKLCILVEITKFSKRQP